MQQVVLLNTQNVNENVKYSSILSSQKNPTGLSEDWVKKNGDHLRTQEKVINVTLEIKTEREYWGWRWYTVKE